MQANIIGNTLVYVETIRKPFTESRQERKIPTIIDYILPTSNVNTCINDDRKNSWIFNDVIFVNSHTMAGPGDMIILLTLLLQQKNEICSLNRSNSTMHIQQCKVKGRGDLVGVVDGWVGLGIEGTTNQKMLSDNTNKSNM